MYCIETVQLNTVQSGTVTQYSFGRNRSKIELKTIPWDRGNHGFDLNTRTLETGGGMAKIQKPIPWDRPPPAIPPKPIPYARLPMGQSQKNGRLTRGSTPQAGGGS